MKEWKKEGMGMWNRKKTIIIAGCSRFGAGLAGELSEHGDDVIQFIIFMDLLLKIG